MPGSISRFQRRHLVAATVGVVVLGATALPMFGASGIGCGRTKTIQVSSSTEKAGLLHELVADYNSESHHIAGGLCGEVRLTERTSGATKNQLASGMDDPPEVWLPTSSMWLNLLAEEGHSRLIADQLGPVTKSTLVLAMPQSVAEALERSGQPMKTWADVFKLANKGWSAYGKPEWKDFRLARDNAETSTSGLAATVASYIAATGGDLSGKRLAEPEVWQFVHEIESSAARYGDEAVRYMQEIYTRQQNKPENNRPYVDAIVVQEQMATMYNRGAPGGNPAHLDKQRPNDPLRAVYPEDGTVELDHPFVVLSSADEDQRAVAENFHEFLLSDDQQQRFLDIGFRRVDDAEHPTEQLRRTLVGQPGRPLRFVKLPNGKQLDTMVKSWDNVKKNARVLLLLDVSDSMNKTVKDANRGQDPSKLELVVPAAQRALDLLGDEDEVGLWTFSSNPSYQPITPVSRVGDVRAQLKAQIRNLTADGDTALYEAIDAASEMMTETWKKDHINAIVVLSDGENTENYPGGSSELLTKLDPANRDTSVPIFTVPYGRENNADIGTLAEIAKRTKASQYDAKNPLNIEDTFIQVFKNFG